MKSVSRFFLQIFNCLGIVVRKKQEMSIDLLHPSAAWQNFSPVNLEEASACSQVGTRRRSTPTPQPSRTYPSVRRW
ncbi:uncharacterized protein LOC143423636 [Xylocopa sonorina]|uniref:uncharacterized protein LOC143423636 n=1 Tax=Xylocopa sonorina TaxID=1818115 RepID=UPI00403AC397